MLKSRKRIQAARRVTDEYLELLLLDSEH